MKILKGEELFDKEGLHILNSKGIAIKAEEDIECEIYPEHVERISQILTRNRLEKGLDAEGNPIPAPAPIQQEIPQTNQEIINETINVQPEITSDEEVANTELETLPE